MSRMTKLVAAIYQTPRLRNLRKCLYANANCDETGGRLNVQGFRTLPARSFVPIIFSDLGSSGGFSRLNNLNPNPGRLLSLGCNHFYANLRAMPVKVEKIQYHPHPPSFCLSWFLIQVTDAQRAAIDEHPREVISTLSW